MKKYLHFEEECWRQKTGIEWYTEGDSNTKFFHNIVNGKRKRLQVKRILNADGQWLENEASIADEAIRFYHHQFTQEQEADNFQILRHISKMVTEEKMRDLVEDQLWKRLKRFFLS